MAGEWRDRFFVLAGGRLGYWQNEADYTAGKVSRNDEEIDLFGYEVFVDTSDAKWGFTLQPTSASDPRRTWHFRAPSEHGRLEWSRRLVLACLVSSN